MHVGDVVLPGLSGRHTEWQGTLATPDNGTPLDGHGLERLADIDILLPDERWIGGGGSGVTGSFFLQARKDTRRRRSRVFMASI